MKDHTSPLALATAAWMHLHGLTQQYQAAVMRGDAEDADRIRREAHDVLDSNLDLNGEAARAIMAILRP
jgi:hypothetical protein